MKTTMHMIRLGLGVLSLSLSAAAATMWTVDNSNDTLYQIDLATRVATAVGPTGVNVVFGGLGFAQNGTLYASTTVNGNSLYTVNQGTGAFSLVGSSNLFGADTFDINPVTNEGIAWNVSGQLHTVNLATGATTFRTAVSPTLPGIASAFDGAGNLWNVDRNLDQLYRVDVNTGAATLIGALGINVSGTNLAFNEADGFLYMVEILTANPNLYRIDMATGAATVVGSITGINNANQQLTMGTIRVGGQVVPEPGTIWLGLTGAGLLVALRRRRA